MTTMTGTAVEFTHPDEQSALRARNMFDRMGHVASLVAYDPALGLYVFTVATT